MAYQKSRTDLVHVRAFTTVSTKQEAASHNRKATIMRASHVSQQQNGRGSSGRSIRTLTFESQQGDQQQTDEDIDVLSVKAVPSNFVSVSKPSEAIERLMTKRKNAHETSLEDMRKEFIAVHEKCADEFRERSNRIKVEMDNIRKDVEEEKSRIQNAHLLKLTDSDLQNTWDLIMGWITREKSSIDQFHERLGEIEHNRQVLVKEVMQKYYEIFHSISYTSTIDIQSLLENEIQDYNKTVLTNFKIYEDLHLHMCINTDDWSRELLNWFELIKNRRSDEIRNENFKQLISKEENLERADEIFLYDTEGLLALKYLSSTLSFAEETIKTCQSKIVIFDALSVNECSKQLSEALTELHISVIKLVDSYKSALQASFDKYKNEVEYFKEENNSSIHDKDMKVLDEAVRSLDIRYKNAGAKFEDLWNRFLSEVQDTVAIICRFLRDFNSIWTKQSSRLVELQERTGSFVDELTAKSQRSIEEMEKKVDTYSQQLRQSSNEEKMKQLLSQISSTLDLIAEKYKFTYNEECKAIKKYIETVTHEVPNIMAQFYTFLDSYGPASVTNNIETDSQDSYYPDFVGQHLKLCPNIVSLIVHWKATLLSEIVAFRDNFTQEIRTAAEIWEDTISSQRESVLQTKLDANSQRFADIESGNYNVRIQEIENHLKHFKDHEMKVNETVKDSSNRLDEFLREIKQSLETYDRNIVQSGEKFPEAKSTAAMKRLQKEIERIREEYKDEVKQKEEGCREELQDILDSLMNRNDDFLNKLRSFKEGGSFSAEEVKSYRKTLISCSKTISKAKITNMQKIDKSIKELSQAIEKSYKTCLEKSNTAMRELKFYEDAQKILTKCASIIERQVYRLLEDDTRFVNSVVNCVKESTKVSCANLNVKTFADQCTQILDLLDARLNNLMVAFPIVKGNSPNNQVKENRKISVVNKRKRQKSMSKVINYRSLFLGSAEIPASENCFATATMNTMLKTIDEVQTEAKTFFSPTSKRTDTEASYHEYMQQILHQMNCYRQQLEVLWRQELQDVLATAEAFDQSISNCIRAGFNECHEKYMNEMTALKGKKMRALSKMMKVYFTRRSELLNSLKMTHGNPGRKNSLDQLTEQVLQEEDSMENTIAKELNEFKNELEELLSSYETSLLEGADPLRQIMKKMKNSSERRRLKELLEKRKRSDLPQFKEVFYRLDIAETSDRRFLEYRQDLASSKDNSFDIESVLSKLLEEAKSVFLSAVQEAVTKADEFVNTGQGFRQNWRSNIDTVVEVYAMLL